MLRIRQSIFPVAILFFVIFAYRFSFRDDFQMLEMLQITANSAIDLLIALSLFSFTRAIPTRLKIKKSRITRGIVIILLGLLCYFLGVFVLQKAHYLIYWMTDGLSGTMIKVFNSLAYQIFDSYLVLAFAWVFLTGYEYYRRWEYSNKQLLQLEHERKNAELNFLKAQINPHFVFNGLNNIHFLIDEKNENARKLVRDFSDLLRYQLYEIGNETVPLTKELDYIKKYIEVQRIRKEPGFEVSMNDILQTNEEWLVAPLMLIIPVENAFKYSASSDTGYVRIEMGIEEGVLEFVVENDLGTKVTGAASGGLGIQNLLRRMDLIYGEQASFDHQQTSENYKAIVRIKLVKSE
jgi:sensor histidine kinase YesM